MNDLTFYNLDSELAAAIIGPADVVGIYDRRPYTPEKLLTLTAEQMWALADWWLDGHCMCGNEIPQGDYLCRNCMDEAIHQQRPELEHK